MTRQTLKRGWRFSQPASQLPHFAPRWSCIPWLDTATWPCQVKSHIRCLLASAACCNRIYIHVNLYLVFIIPCTWMWMFVNKYTILLSLYVLLLRNMLYNTLYLANIFQGRNKYELMYSTRWEAPSRLFSSYSMRPRKIFALFILPEEDTFIGICLGVCKLLYHR